MSKPHYLSSRANWQLNANNDGSKNEVDVFSALSEHLDPEEFKVEKQPKWFKAPFLEYMHSLEPMVKPEFPGIGDEWYENGDFFRNTEKGPKKIQETFIPDIGITHIPSNRRYIIEAKNQKAEGNAHERACKYMAPGMIEYLKDSLNIEYHPVGYIFSGGIADDNSYCREILFFTGKELRSHVFFWKCGRDSNKLAEWFDSTIRPLLCQ